jgi:hypothetical protein
VDRHGAAIQGAKVTIEQFPELPPVETATNGWFTFERVPKSYGEEVRVVVEKENYKPNPYKRDVTLGASPPTITLRRIR